MAEAAGADERVQLEVLGLAEQLALEVLHTRPRLDTREDIHAHCAQYLETSISERAVSERMAAATNAWSDEKRAMKQRQMAFMTSSSQVMTSPSKVAKSRPSSSDITIKNLDVDRCKSAPYPHRLAASADCLSSDSDSDGVDKALSRRHTIQYDEVTQANSLPKSANQRSRAHILQNGEDGETDSGFNTSEGIDYNTRAKSGTCESSIPSPSSSLLSTSIGEHTVSEDEPRSRSSSLQITAEADEGKQQEVECCVRPEEPEPQIEEDDFCTFAFFKSTTERGSQKDSEDGSKQPVTKQISVRTQTTQSHEHDSHIRTLVGHESAVTQCCVVNHFVATSSRDGTLRIWSLSTGKPLRTLNCKRPVHDFQLVNFRTRLPYLVLGCEDGAIILVRLKEDKETGAVSLSLGGEYTGHLPNPIRTMAISPTRLDLATGCCFMMNQIGTKGRALLACRGTLKTWDLDGMLRTAEEGKTYDGSPCGIRTMHQLVSRAPSLHISRRLNYGQQPNYGLRSLSYSPDGSLLVVGLGHPDDSGILDQHLMVVLQSQTMATIWMEDTHLCQVTRLDFLPPLRKRIYPGDTFPLILSTLNRAALVNFSQDADKKLSVEYTWVKKFEQPHFGAGTSPNGKIVVCCLGMDVLVCACATGKELLRIENAHDGWVRGVCFSPDSSKFVTVATDGSVKLWNTPDADNLIPPYMGPKRQKPKPQKQTSSASGNAHATASTSTSVSSSGKENTQF